MDLKWWPVGLVVIMKGPSEKIKKDVRGAERNNREKRRVK